MSPTFEGMSARIALSAILVVTTRVTGALSGQLAITKSEDHRFPATASES